MRTNNQSDWSMKMGKSRGSNTMPNDLYPTPGCAVRALLNHWVPRSTLIWECASGMGHITEALQKEGIKVCESDIVDYGREATIADFTAEDSPNLSSCIITNPPYKLLNQFLLAFERRNLDEGALLCSINGLTSGKRAAILQRLPLTQILIFAKPIPMFRNGEWENGFFHHVWLVFDRQCPVAAPTVEWAVHDGKP